MTLGEQADCVTEIPVQLTVLQFEGWFRRLIVDKHVDECEIVLDPIRSFVLECEYDAAKHPILELVEFALAHPQRLGNFFLARHSAKFGCETLLDVLEFSTEATNRTRGPIGSPDGIQNRTANSLRSKPFERNPAGFVEPTGRFDEAQGAGPRQFVTVDMTGELNRHLEHDVLHQREIRLDQLGQLDRNRVSAQGGAFTST